eukprot:COSAG06_NODE_27903_length_584_cov_0.960825_1_plen_30_part_10
METVAASEDDGFVSESLAEARGDRWRRGQK